ncbi:MAG: HAMP domain-containing sensor histidine kinase [Planctomycetota bacterium]
MTHPESANPGPEPQGEGPKKSLGSGWSPLRFEGGAAGGPPDAADAPYVLDRLAVLTHEMGNLLDGSLRTLELARRAVDRSAHAGETQSGELGEALRRIDVVQTSLARMADLVTSSMRPAVSAIGTSLLGPSTPVTTEEAVAHAMDVVRPIAEERGVRLSVELAAPAGQAMAGPIYTVVLNALWNAVDSIELACKRDPASPRAGEIEVLVRPEEPLPGESGQRMVIEIRDDGVGPPPSTPTPRLFDHGVTTKPEGQGIGLSLARSVVRELGGVIELNPRPDRMGRPRPGATLRVSYPLPTERHASLGREER